MGKCFLGIHVIEEIIKEDTDCYAYIKVKPSGHQEAA